MAKYVEYKGDIIVTKELLGVGESDFKDHIKFDFYYQHRTLSFHIEKADVEKFRSQLKGAIRNE